MGWTLPIGLSHVLTKQKGHQRRVEMLISELLELIDEQS